MSSIQVGKSDNSGAVISSIPIRISVSILMFFGTWCSYMLRFNLSFTIVDMICRKDSIIHTDPTCIVRKKNDSIGENKNITKCDSMDWDNLEQGHLLSVYFYGYAICQIFGGRVAQSVGAKHTIGWSTLITALLSLSIPFAATKDFYSVLAVRALMGIFAGLVYPAMHLCIRRWSPPKEISRFTSSLLGGKFGAIFTWPLCAVLTSLMGWKLVFYAQSSVVAMWSIVWMCVVSETPVTHPRISKAEYDYITRAFTDCAISVDHPVPWKHIFLSVPFFGLMFLHICNMWGYIFMLLEGPRIFRMILDYSPLTSSFVAASVPAARLLTGFFFKCIYKRLRRRQTIKAVTIHKLYAIVSHIIPAVLMALAGSFLCDKTIATVLLVATMGFNGAAVGLAKASAHAMAPNFADALLTVLNFMGVVPGIVIPLMVGLLIQEEDSVQQWRTIFIVNGSIYAFGGLLYIQLGQSTAQAWDYVILGPMLAEDAENASPHPKISSVTECAGEGPSTSHQDTGPMLAEDSENASPNPKISSVTLQHKESAEEGPSNSHQDTGPMLAEDSENASPDPKISSVTLQHKESAEEGPSTSHQETSL